MFRLLLIINTLNRYAFAKALAKGQRRKDAMGTLCLRASLRHCVFAVKLSKSKISFFQFFYRKTCRARC